MTPAQIAEAQKLARKWKPVNRRADHVAVHESVVDVVDGARSRQRGPIKVIVVSESHQGATPCKLQRSVWI
jgi:hypothetical protein